MSAPANMNPSLLADGINSSADMVSRIAQDFRNGKLVSYLSTQVLVACNNYTPPDKDLTGPISSSIAATKDLAARAMARLKHRSENQAIVFYGESGSGKTTLRSHLLSSILAHSSTPLSAQLSYAAYIFDSLTTTRTTLTPTASKSGLFYELQYNVHNDKTHLVGGKLLDHRLERSRVTDSSLDERNYHIFYYLLSGASGKERAHIDFPPVAQTGSSAEKASRLADHWRYLKYAGDSQKLASSYDADAVGFTQFKQALLKLRFHPEVVAHICLLLATVMYLGQLEFTRARSNLASGNESGGYGAEGGENITVVSNTDVLDRVAAFLGITAEKVQGTLCTKNKKLGNDNVTILLDPKGARANADELARTLYALLVTYIMEQINSSLCASDDQFSNVVSIVDFPGPATNTSSSSAVDVLLTNTANESLYNFCTTTYFEDLHETLDQEGVDVPETNYFANSHTVDALQHGKCLLSVLDGMKPGSTDIAFLDKVRDMYAHKHKQLPADQKHYKAIVVDDSLTKQDGSNFKTTNLKAKFTVNHFHSNVEYAVDGILAANGELIASDIQHLISTSTNDFVKGLWPHQVPDSVYTRGDKSTILPASISSKPSRQPSVMNARKPRRKSIESQGGVSTTKSAVAQQPGAAGQYLIALSNISNSLSSTDTNAYFCFCLRPNVKREHNKFDSRAVIDQVQSFGLPFLRERLRVANVKIFVDYDKFLQKYNPQNVAGNSIKQAAEAIIDSNGWPPSEAKSGLTGILLSERLWFEWSGVSISPLSSLRRPGDDRGYVSQDGTDGDPNARLLAYSGSSTPAFDDKQAYMDTRSDAGNSALNGGDMFRNMATVNEMAEKAQESKMEEIDQYPTSASRKRWLFVVWTMTFLVPDFLIKWASKKHRVPDVRMAWREKLAINMLIWLACAFVIFFMVGFPALICPKQHVYSAAELSSYNAVGKAHGYVSIRGIVYDLSAFSPVHYPRIVAQKSILNYAGKDITNLFPVQVSSLCNGVSGSIDPAVQLDYRLNNYTGTSTTVSTTDLNAQYHDFRWATNDSRPDWWWEQQIVLKANYMKGRVGLTPKYIKSLGLKGSAIAILNGRVYDFTTYVPGGRSPQYPLGFDIPTTKPDTNFMDDTVVSLFSQRAGSDITKYWEALRIDSALRSRMNTCMNNLFYVGDVDTRGSTKCLFATYLLLAISIILVTVIGFKFLSALQFTKKSRPENLDKFVICTIPAYTEDEESLRRAIDSAARMDYDDKRKLLFIICDGMIMGEGNDRPTPRIVLDILGVAESVNPEALSFQSLGEGQKQHNKGQVYTGLYEVHGHIVPFLVVVKVGRPSELSRPGNRGKRDSQMLLMRFLNRVHYNLPMAPMELEMFHQIRNVIGVNPSFYEFLFQIDADTEVARDSATRMIAAFVHDTRILGLCGETSLMNAKDSLVTMMQVYEYFISHNLTKAFESLFGSVTCLPGCFSMYRIRDAESEKALFVSKEVVEAYSEIRVDTLHMKNLLHLGEDRFLTTLLLKFHSKYKTKYLSTAHASTIAPDSWSVFMSQRRRWINSTVHNLIELIPLTQLCGFCCFSMRFVVFLDLLSTLVQPTIVGYITYLIYLVVSDSSVIPVTAFILLGAIYGLQVIIFLVRRKWDMIVWMLIYLLATPIFAFGLPLYSFWHMDDFSWGNTRVVTGEKGQKIIVSDEGKFDPTSIPFKKWDDYQRGLLGDLNESHDHGFDSRSAISAFSQSGVSQSKSGYGYGGGSYPYAQSGVNPYETSEYNLVNPNASRPHSHLDMYRGSVAGSSYGNPGPDVEMASMSADGQPSDHEITMALDRIFRLLGPGAGSLTRRNIRDQLYAHFAPISITHRREFVDEEIVRFSAGIPAPPSM